MAAPTRRRLAIAASPLRVPLGGGDVVGVGAVDGGAGGVVDDVGVVESDVCGAGQGRERRPGVDAAAGGLAVASGRQSLAVLATQRAAGRTGESGRGRRWPQVDKIYDDFALVELTDLNGKVLATSRTGQRHRRRRTGLVPHRRAGQPVVTSLVASASTSSGSSPSRSWRRRPPEGCGDRRPRTRPCWPPAQPGTGRGQQVVAVDAQHQLLYDTEHGRGRRRRRAARRRRAEHHRRQRRHPQQAVSTGEPGTARFTDPHGPRRHRRLRRGRRARTGSCSPKTTPASVLAPVTSQRNAPSSSSPSAPSSPSAFRSRWRGGPPDPSGD